MKHNTGGFMNKGSSARLRSFTNNDLTENRPNELSPSGASHFCDRNSIHPPLAKGRCQTSSRTFKAINQVSLEKFSRLPQSQRKTLIFDNDKEFIDREELAQNLRQTAILPILIILGNADSTNR